MGNKAKSKIVSLFVTVSFSLTLLFTSYCKSTPGNHSNSNDETDTTGLSSREIEIQKCAACHPKEYKNWLKGPHSRAYALLKEHQKVVNQDTYYTAQWAAHVNLHYEGRCMSCHTGENLYETNFAGLEMEKDPSKFNSQNFPKMEALATNRKDPKTYSTGVDCLTCHKAGNRVVTNSSYVPLDPQNPPVCNPIASNFFSTNWNCYSCHLEKVRFMEAGLPEPFASLEQNCVNCHQEYDENDRPTHYYFWHVDDLTKINHKHLKSMFDGVTVQVSKNEKNLILSWVNQVEPHPYAMCNELSLKVEILDSSNNLLLSDLQRVNRKIDHTEIEMHDIFGGDSIPGEVGFSFDPNAPGLRKEYPIKSADGLKVKLTGFYKPHYWIPDKYAQYSFESVIDPK